MARGACREGLTPAIHPSVLVRRIGGALALARLHHRARAVGRAMAGVETAPGARRLEFELIGHQRLVVAVIATARHARAQRKSSPSFRQSIWLMHAVSLPTGAPPGHFASQELKTISYRDSPEHWVL